MNARLVLAPALVGVLVAGVAGAQAAPPTLDGRKVKTLKATYTPASQDHDADQVTEFVASLNEVLPAPLPVTAADRMACKPPRCGRLEFVYKPAKGVRGGLAVQTSWSTPGTDVDLYLVEIAKDGTASDLQHCGASAGTSEKFFVAGSSLKPGKKYAVITDFYRVASDTVTTQVTFPGTVSTKSTAPAQVDAVVPVNCGL